jgi:phosphoribosyl-ATP pyrophosphohydrolase
MNDSMDRLYAAVMVAKDLDPAVSRTARLFRRGPAKMAKKVAEEAIEVVIDALNGKTDAVVRESADLLYNLSVLWASAGITPEDVWAEMERRERMLGIAEKLPKANSRHKAGLYKKAGPHKNELRKAVSLKAAADKTARKLTKSASGSTDRRRIVAVDGQRLRKRG